MPGKGAYIRLRDGGICVYCQQEVGQVIEHVLSRSLGGKNTVDNMVLACQRCNMKKAGLHEEMMVKAFVYLSRVEPLAGGQQSGLNNVMLEEPKINPLSMLRRAIGHLQHTDQDYEVEEHEDEYEEGWTEDGDSWTTEDDDEGDDSTASAISILERLRNALMYLEEGHPTSASSVLEKLQKDLRKQAQIVKFVW